MTLYPANQLGQWVYNNVAALFLPLLALVSLWFLAKRQFTRFLGFAAFAVVVSFFVFAGEELKEIILLFTRWAFGR